MANTDNIEAPFLDQNVAQPEIPHNEALTVIDAAICGILSMTTAGMIADTAYTLDDLSATYPQEWQHGIIEADVACTIATNILVPDSKVMKYTVNNTSGQNIVFKTVSGTGVTVPTATVYHMYSDGTNIIRIT